MPDNESFQTKHLAEQFTSLEQQRETSELGMWVFLATEVLFFGSLFLALTVYRTMYKDIFTEAARHLNVVIGTANTAILLTSSLTMVMAIQAIKDGKIKQTFNYLIGTAFLGFCFLGLKAVEYREDFAEHLFPGQHFLLGPQAKLFFFLYFFMTALHALHLFVGICVVSVMAYRSKKGNFSKDYFNPIEVTGLYWHFVDIVWVFLFPLLYLAGRNS